MKSKQVQDGSIYIFTEKDVKEALVQYIENWEDSSVPQFREFNFVGNELHLCATSIESKESLQATAIKIQKKRKKKSRKQRKNIK